MTLDVAKKSDIVITTALIPGRKAVLIFYNILITL